MDAPDLRIFVSSTFWDFKRERDILNTEILPILREYAWQRGTDVMFVDLRWGLTGEDGRNGDIARLCLEEADACKPLFLGLLGGRYGTVLPRGAISADQLSDDLRLKVDLWCNAGMSLTAMEVHHAVLARPEAATDAIFLLRMPDLTRKWAEDAGVCPASWGVPTDLRQQALREELRRLLPGRARDYASADQFRELAVEHLMKLVAERLGPLPILDGPQREALRQQARAKRLLRHFQPDEAFLGQVWGNLEAGKSVVLTGPPGRGSSANAAWLAKRAEAAGWQVFVVCPEQEANPFATAARQLTDIAASALGRDGGGSNDDPRDLLGSLATRAPVLVVLDGLARPGEPVPVPEWVSDQLPAGVRLLTTATEETPLRYDLTTHGLIPITVPLLAPAARATLAGNVLADARKRLTADQMQRIWSCEASANPAFLRTLLDELIAFGELQAGAGDQDAFIDAHALGPLLAAPDLADLCKVVLSRVEGVIGHDEAARFTTALALALGGLQENELSQACDLDAATVLRLRRAYGNHLASHGGLLVPARRAFADAVLVRYEKVARDTGEGLANWFCKEWREGRNLPRVVQELPWLLWKANRDKDLADALVDPLVFVVHLEGSGLQHLWASIGSDELAGRAVERLMDSHDRRNVTWGERARENLLLARCLLSAGLSEGANRAYHGVWLWYCSPGGITTAQANTALGGYLAAVCAEIAGLRGKLQFLTLGSEDRITQDIERAYKLVGALRETGGALGGCVPVGVELQIADLERGKEDFIRLSEPNEPVPLINEDPVLAALDRADAALNGMTGATAHGLAAKAMVMRLERRRTRFAHGGDRGSGIVQRLLADIQAVRTALRAYPFWDAQRILANEVVHSLLCDVGHKENDPTTRRNLYAQAVAVATEVLDAVQGCGTFAGEDRRVRLLNAVETQSLARGNGAALSDGELERANAILRNVPPSSAADAAVIALCLNRRDRVK